MVLYKSVQKYELISFPAPLAPHAFPPHHFMMAGSALRFNTSHVSHLPAESFHDGGICAALRYVSRLTPLLIPL